VGQVGNQFELPEHKRGGSYWDSEMTCLDLRLL
jgi:hypothetical protein